MPGKQFKKGNTVFTDALAKLSPEEYKELFAKRTKKRAMKKAMETVVEAYQAEWIAELHSTAAVLAKKARAEGDTHAFMAVWDRIIGKPTADIRVEADASADMIAALAAMAKNLPN